MKDDILFRYLNEASKYTIRLNLKEYEVEAFYDPYLLFVMEYEPYTDLTPIDDGSTCVEMKRIDKVYQVKQALYEGEEVSLTDDQESNVLRVFNEQLRHAEL